MKQNPGEGFVLKQATGPTAHFCSVVTLQITVSWALMPKQYSFDLPEQVRMGPRIEKQQIKFSIVLLPYHQPIRLNVAFPLAAVISAEDMWTILCRKSPRFRQNTDCGLNARQIQAALLTKLKIFFEPVGKTDAVHTMPMPA